MQKVYKSKLNPRKDIIEEILDNKFWEIQSGRELIILSKYLTRYSLQNARKGLQYVKQLCELMNEKWQTYLLESEDESVQNGKLGYSSDILHSI